jgi:hypothetical protein
VIRRKRNRQLWAPTVAGSGWSESTLAEQAWEVERGAAMRWAIAGVVFGLLVGLVLFAPAAWLAKAVASATNQRLLLADARGTIWSGSAVPILTGGADSRDASYLPGRLEWTLSPRLYGVELGARQDCCINGTLKLQIRPASAGSGHLCAAARRRQRPSAHGRAPGSAASARRGTRCSSAARRGSPRRASRSSRSRAAGGSTASSTWSSRPSPRV